MTSVEVSLENQQIGFVVVVIVCFTFDKQIKDRLSTLIRRGWNWVWWCMPLLTALGKQRHTDRCKFKVVYFFFLVG